MDGLVKIDRGSDQGENWTGRRLMVIGSQEGREGGRGKSREVRCVQRDSIHVCMRRGGWREKK